MASRKKFQVFVSSTYLDLKSERQAAVQAILEAGHIPAGMELFGAGDESQKEVIKQWIDESDIYMLILGNRYGTPQPGSDISYTRWEYEYAVSINKPFFAVVMSDDTSERRKQDHDMDYYHQWKAFRSLVTSKVVEFWDDERDIQNKIFKKLGKFTFDGTLIGWVPGSYGIDTGQLAEQMARLNRENDELTRRNNDLMRQVAAASTIVSPNGLSYNEIRELLFKTKLDENELGQEILDVLDIPANSLKIERSCAASFICVFHHFFKSKSTITVIGQRTYFQTLSYIEVLRVNNYFQYNSLTFTEVARRYMLKFEIEEPEIFDDISKALQEKGSVDEVINLLFNAGKDPLEV